VVTPSSGGETYFVDSTSAYQDLEEETKARLRGLKGHYTYLKWRDQVPGIDDSEPALRGAVHPLFITHPVTGLKNIYANHGHCASVVGVQKEESDEILALLAKHVDQPKYRYVHWWKDGDMAFWDNRGRFFFHTSTIT
jgi:alpha-ketoglutarate-dependent taurine dioxygenase